ncbi:uncharacterized protein LOC127783052 [Oryza glaberrima]|uniref:uncharacterized protein LOC127783052 n=1 Tax=Oryza glaberrima TaxID=4538 RepID=UPI00224C208F|nr:uncharacterized protein LOC127783052 [Oryza glaberrima]
MDGSGDTARRAMRSSPGDGVAAATINRSSTTSTDTKSTPTPFPHSGATGVGPDRKLNTALFLLRLYIHKDLKHEYMLETSPLNLWKALKERYDQQKELIWPEANYEWVEVLRIRANRGREDRENSINYASGGQDTDSTRPPGSAPLPEVHFNVQNNAENKKGFKGNSLNNPKNLTGKRKCNNRRKFKGRKKGKGKGKAPQPRSNGKKHCNRCGSNTHVAKDCHISKHLVLLYQKSLKDKKSSENPRFEAHFNLTNEERPEVASSHQAPVEPESNLNVLPEDVAPLSVMDDMFIEYCSTDPLEDLQ